MDTKTQFYLFACHPCKPEETAECVFYRVEGEALAQGLREMMQKEYDDAMVKTAFHFFPAQFLSPQNQVLLDEALHWLDVYRDPDPGVYDPEPSKRMVELAAYAVRAREWEPLLRAKLPGADPEKKENVEDGEIPQPPSVEQWPEMPPEDFRNAGLGLLMLLAQAYYRMLEAATGKESPCSALDLELNASYFWTVKCLRNLLGNHPDLKDFPIKFEPLFLNLYPTSLLDVEWPEMVAPHADEFLSTVQSYVAEKGLYEPEDGSPAWIFIELFRPSVNEAIEASSAYTERMAAAWAQRLSVHGHNPASSSNSSGSTSPSASPEVKTRESTGGPTEPRVATGTGTGNVPRASKKSAEVVTKHVPHFALGRLQWSEGYNKVILGTEEYNLSTRPPARRCIEFLVTCKATSIQLAQHIKDIDLFVKPGGRYKDSRPIKIQHYFNDNKGKLPKLCEQLIASVPGEKRYFLKVD